MHRPTAALDVGASRYAAVARGLSELTVDRAPTSPAATRKPRPGWPTGPEPHESGDSADVRLLIPYNGTEAARSALDMATGLGPVGRVSAWVLYVRHWDTSGAGPRQCLESAEDAQACVLAAVAELRRGGLPASGVVRNAPREKVGHAIAAEAERLRVTCIVMGTHGHGPMLSVLLGSVTRKVAGLTTRPLVLVRPSRHPRARGPVRALTEPITDLP